VRLHGNPVLVTLVHDTTSLAERVQLRTTHEYVEQVVLLQTYVYLVDGRRFQSSLGKFFEMKHAAGRIASICRGR
jgi:hypothetical protein